MERAVAAYVEVEGEGLSSEFPAVLQIPYDSTWADFELMLKCSFGFEHDRIELKYYDEDDDAVIMSSDEELQEAFKVAKKFNHTLRLSLKPTLDYGEKDAPERPPTRRPPVPSAPPSIPPPPLPPKQVPSPPVVTLDPPAVEPGSGSVVCDAAPVCSMEVEPAVEAGAVQRESMELDSSLDMCEDAAESVAAPDTTSTRNSDPKIFAICHQRSCLVLDVDKDGGTLVTLQTRRRPNNGVNQMFYEDLGTQTIRSLYNNRCLGVGGDGFVAALEYDGSTDQSQLLWCLEGEMLRNRLDLDQYMHLENMEAGSHLILMTGVGELDDKWTFQEVMFSSVVSAPEKRDGHKSSKKAEKKLKEYYGQMSRDASRPGTRARMMRSRRARDDEREPSGDEIPPAWFYSYMDQFKREIASDIAHLVTRRTVRQVLRGLEDAEVHTTFSRDPPHHAVVEATVVGEGSTENSSDNTAYEPIQGTSDKENPSRELVPHHVGVICDGCEGGIMGVRYKCGNCLDFDLCEKCESQDTLHDPSHIFLKIRRPTRGLGLRKNGKVVPLLKNNVYCATQKDEKKDQAYFNLLDRFQRLQNNDDHSQHLPQEERALRRREKRMLRRRDRGKEAAKDCPKKKERLERHGPLVALHMDAIFVSDDTVPDGTHVQPGTKFRKSWVLRNAGSYPWTKNTKLYLLWGNIPTRAPEVDVPHLGPEQEGVVTVELLAPEEPGSYKSHWRLSHHGQRFGHRVWCSIIVDPKEVLEPPAVTSLPLLELPAPPTTQQVVKESATPVSSPDDIVVIEAEEPATGKPGPADEADGLSAQDLLQFEMLDIHQRSPPKVSQTATPTNTPLDVSPPKSPVPELNEAMQALSSSSSVEIVPETPAEDLTMTELVQEKIESLRLHCNAEDDVQSLSSYTDSDSDSDFYIVPLPDCFIPDRPMSSSVTSVVVTKDELKKKSDEQSASGQFVLATPVVPDSQPAEPEVIVITDDDDDDDDEASFIHAAADLGDAADSGHASEDSDHMTPRHEPMGQGSLSVCSLPPEEFSASLSVSKDIRGEVMELDAEAAGRVIQIEDDDGIAHEIRQGDENGNQATEDGVVHVDDPEIVEIRRASSEPPSGSKPESPKSPSDVAASVITAAFGAASHAAASAFSTAKDVFHTLQAQNKYVPPKSSWTPPPQKWTPPTEEWTYPQEQWAPVAPQWTPEPEATSPPPPVTQMDTLIEMGFANRQLNQELLDKYEGNMEKVVQELIQNGDNDWYANRH